jgi:protein-S-isoprenylcysteine O-methyltransferase Ste14
VPQPDAQRESGWRAIVFRNRGLLLVPVALLLVVFGAPSRLSAVVGIFVATLGELIRIWAVGYSGLTTRSHQVTAPQLVTAGPYAFVRNPLYLGNAIIALGFWLAFSGNVPMATALILLAVIAVLVVSVYASIIPLEESYLAQNFGAEYEAYRQKVPRLLPLVVPLPKDRRRGAWSGQTIARAEVITLTYFVLMVAAVIFKLWAAA